MVDPLFWLALSFLLVVVSLTAVLMVAIPALRELGRAARSAEKLFDTLGRELPPTLEAIRLTGLEITELTDDLTEGVHSAGQVVEQVHQGLTSAQTGAKQLTTGTRSALAGAKAAWQTWANPEKNPSPLPQVTGDRPRPSTPAQRPISSGTVPNQTPDDTPAAESKPDRRRPAAPDPLPRLAESYSQEAAELLGQSAQDTNRSSGDFEP